MTERRDGPRRVEDQTLSDKLDSHIEDFNELKDVLMTGDFVLPSGITANEAVEEHASIHEANGRILDVLMGPEVEQMDGTKRRDESLGLVAKVDRIDNRLVNGGVKVKIPPGMWVLMAGIVGGLATLIAAMIQRV